MANQQPAKRPPLPTAPRPDGRPVWEPPLLDYSDLVDEECEKMRDALMRHFAGDKARVTGVMDDFVDAAVMGRYFEWVDGNLGVGGGVGEFFRGLKREVRGDMNSATKRWMRHGVLFERGVEGGKRYFVESGIEVRGVALDGLAEESGCGLGGFWEEDGEGGDGDRVEEGEEFEEEGEYGGGMEGEYEFEEEVDYESGDVDNCEVEEAGEMRVDAAAVVLGGLPAETKQADEVVVHSWSEDELQEERPAKRQKLEAAKTEVFEEKEQENETGKGKEAGRCAAM